MPLTTEIAASQLSRRLGMPNVPALAAQCCGRLLPVVRDVRTQGAVAADRLIVADIPCHSDRMPIGCSPAGSADR
jgi:hypothetical protein